MPRRLAAVYLALLSVSACGAAPETTRSGLPTQKLSETILITLPDGFEVTAEVADEPVELGIGLMGRSEVPPGTGMLFVFPEAEHRSFWMKNCLTALDLLWLAETERGGRVVHVEARVPPCKEDPCPNYLTQRAARFVLELGPGEAARHGLSRGREVRFDHASLPARPAAGP